MRRLDRLCVGFNFSGAAQVALRSAAAVGRAFGAAIDLVAVIEPAPLYRRVLSPIHGRLACIEDVSVGARRKLEEVARELRSAHVPVECHVRSGRPYVELIAACRELQDDMVVLGPHCRSQSQHLSLGSTAERVLRKASVPVLIAKSELPALPSLVLVPVDFSSAGKAAVVEASVLVRRWNSKLVLLHVVEPLAEAYMWPLEPGAVALYPVEPDELEPEWDAWLGNVDLSGLACERLTLKGHAAETIVETAAQLAADLVVMGTHGRSGIAHALLGSVTLRVAREAPCSVLAIRPEGP